MAGELHEQEEFLRCVRANQDFRLRTYYAELKTDFEEKISVTGRREEEPRNSFPAIYLPRFIVQTYQRRCLRPSQ
jgi:hypothetical protein